MKSRVGRMVLMGIGCVGVALGVVGIVVPVLPATPFLLGAAVCFGRSSPRLSAWLMSTPFLARRIERLRKGGGLSAKDKLGIYLVALGLLSPVLIFSPSLHLRIFIGVLLAVKGLVFLIWRPGAGKRPVRGIPGPHKATLVLTLAAELAGSLVSLGLYGLVAVLVVQGIPGEVWIWIALGAGIVFRLFLGYLARSRLYRVSRPERRYMRTALMRRFWQIQDQGGTLDQGQAAAILGEGMDSLVLYRGLYLPQLILGMGAPLIILGVMALVDVQTALLLLCLVPLTPLVIGLLQRQFRKVSGQYREANAALLRRFQEGILGLSTLGMAGTSGEYGARVDADAQRHRRSAVGLLAVNQLMILILDFSASLGLSFLTAWMAWQRSAQGAIGGTAALFLVLASLELIRPQQRMGAFFFAGGLGRSTLKTARSLLGGLDSAPESAEIAPEVTPEVTTRAVAQENPVILQGITELRARDVRVSWPDHEVVVPGEITLAKGLVTSLEGPSGCGKTTLRRVFAGLICPQEGVVCRYPGAIPCAPRDLRRMVAVADQYPYLFSGSLGDNLRYANPQARDHELMAVVRRLGLEGISGFSAWGLERELGEEGRLLSGGQKARVSLARALLSARPFLILDEPSADLDPDTEAVVARVILEESPHRGILLISHRPALRSIAHRWVTMPEQEA